MNRSCGTLAATFSAVALAAAQPASALPVLQMFIDTPFTLNARVSDGPPLPGINNFPPLIGGVHWGLNMTVRTFGAPGNDSFDVLGTVEHIIPPHAEGPGAQFSFFMSFGSFGKANGFHGFGDTGPLIYMHGDHSDVYQAFGTAEVFAGQIASWHIDIRGLHSSDGVPAPAGVLLGAGALAAAGCRRRR